MSKPKVIKDYNKLEKSIHNQIKLSFPWGFENKLVTFKNAKGKIVSALPFETEKYHYLIRMTQDQARSIILNDDDYNEDGQLKAEVKNELEAKLEELPEDMKPKDQDKA